MSEVLAKAHVVGAERVELETQQIAEEPWASAYGDGSVVEPPYSLEGLAQLYETNATNKACVDAKVSNIVGLGYRFVRTAEEASSEDLARVQGLFSQCNPEATFTEILRGVWTDVETIGNGYLEVLRNRESEVAGFYHIPGTTVRVSPLRDKYLQIRNERKQWFRKYAAANRHVTDSRNEVLHFRKYTPQSSYYGVPDVVAAASAVAGDRAAREYNLDFFEHNAVPRMAIIVEGGQLSDELIRQIQYFMDSEVRGQGHKTLVLDVPGSDVKVRIEPLTVGAQDDASFLSYRRANRDEVLMVHRVPPSKITVVENANLANTKDQDKTFCEQVVRPEQRRIEYQINKIIREDMGVEGWEFRFREMDLGAEREQAEISRLYHEMGVWDAEQVRARLSM